MRSIINSVLKQYDIPGISYQPITSKSMKVTCTKGDCFLIKETSLYMEEKIRYLRSQNVSNIIYPLKNNNDNYISLCNNKLYYLTPFIRDNKMIDEMKFSRLNNELNSLHTNTSYKKELSPLSSKKKFEKIFDYLQYKFNSLESFVRTIEARDYDEYSILILKDYRYILDAKNVIGRLNKRLIDYVKQKITIDYSVIHNNPKLNHLISTSESDYLISFEKAKIGVPTLDIVKFYIETEDIRINRNEIIKEYFRNEDSFYFDYFCFFVLFYYIKGIVIIDKDYVSSQSFAYYSKVIKSFIEDFDLK